MQTYINPFHKNNLYLKLEDFDIENVTKEDFEKLINENKKPLQIGISSDKLSLIKCLKEFRFVLKRKTYEMDVRKADLKEGFKIKENGNNIRKSYKGDIEYKECSRKLYE